MSDWSVLGLAADPAPGDPAAAARLAGRLRQEGNLASQAGSRLGTVSGRLPDVQMQGDYAPTYTNLIQHLPALAAELDGEYQHCGDALATFATDLLAAQAMAASALAAGVTAAADLQAAQDTLHRAPPLSTSPAAQSSGGGAPFQLPAARQADLAQQALSAARAKAQQAASMWAAAVDRCVRGIDAALVTTQSGKTLTTPNAHRHGLGAGKFAVQHRDKAPLSGDEALLLLNSLALAGVSTAAVIELGLNGPLDAVDVGLAGTEEQLLEHVIDHTDAAVEDGELLRNGVKRYPDGQLRTADGRFAGTTGVRAGATAEAATWKALENDGLTVVKRGVYVHGNGAHLRIYDGAIPLGNNTYIGIEIKSGSATLTPQQKQFDTWVRGANVATGFGQTKGFNVIGVIEIRAPAG